MRRFLPVFGLTAVALSSLSTRSLALTGANGPAPLLQRLEEDRRDWHVHPFAVRSPGDDGFRLSDALKAGALSLDEAVGRLIRASSSVPFLSLKTIKTPSSSLAASTGTESQTYAVHFAGVPVCGMFVRAHRLADGTLAAFGGAPSASDATVTTAADWPRAEAALNAARTALESEYPGADHAVLEDQNRCYVPAHGTMNPAWRLTVRAGGFSYDVIANEDRAFSVEERFFTVTGKAKIYPQNSGDKLTDVNLPDLNGDGTLSGTRHKVIVPDSYTTAKNAQNIFNYEITDKQFVQPNLYAHLEAQYEFFKSLGYAWPDGKMLEIRPHLNDDPNVGYNNGFYQIGDGTAKVIGTIKLGDGDGVVLQNLALDADVVSHEFGHQVVYGYLTNATRCRESLALHEGLADFFAFARTGDPCLGETICPEGSPGCVIPQCLRTAAVDFKYEDDQWKAWSSNDSCYRHNSGQLFSGLLWDMRAAKSISGDDLSKLAFRAVQAFRPDSGFRDFLLALFLADSELYASKYRATLLAAMKARGLDTIVSDVTANTTDPIPTPNGLQQDGTTGTAAGSGSASGSGSTTPTPEAEKKDSAKKKGLSCAVGSSDAAGDRSAQAETAALILLPFAILACRRARRRPR